MDMYNQNIAAKAALAQEQGLSMVFSSSGPGWGGYLDTTNLPGPSYVPAAEVIPGPVGPAPGVVWNIDAVGIIF
jgi:hypothetical protein